MAQEYKKAPEFSDAFLVEYLRNSSPLIGAEIRRWRYILWDDYIEYEQDKKRLKLLRYPLR